ncbi:cytochrome-c peroxidase [Bradyrhizobium sp. STM 3562]|uniref:cytochrome-c peroxidase n=1 Tax=Bradyrhizobium sp. STM 3562 TaxID=578924 RepID=UPI00388F32FD
MMRAWSPAFSARLSPPLWGLACVVVLLVSIAATQAPAPPPAPPQTNHTADQEPITPIPPPPAADPLKLALGERLFGDGRLSETGNVACSSCHDLSTNGAGNRRRMAQDGTRLTFDTPTVFNAALSFRLNWEGNFRTLAAQAVSSIESPGNDMHSSVVEVVRKLNADPAISRKFYAAYGQAPDRDNFLDALVTFERSLLTPGSRFDRWLEGGATALSSDELEGYRIFKSYGCSSCHQGVNVGGNLFERQGVFRPLVEGQPKIVRVPSLRNVATTAPYFHDGSAATLEEAVRRMAAAQLDRTLTDQQVASVVAFLQTLTGNYRGKPVVGASP